MKQFTVGAYWRDRPETPSEVAGRLKTLVGSLRPIALPFERWYQVVANNNVPELDDDENWLASAVAARALADDLGAPVAASGYMLVTMNSPPRRRPQSQDVLSKRMPAPLWQTNRLSTPAMT